MDWIAAIFELLGIFCLSQKNRLGFIFNIIGCSMWFYLSCIHPDIRGLMLVAGVAIVINTYGFMKWTNN